MRLVLLAIFLLAARVADSAEVIITRQQGKLGARVLAVTYPPSLAKDLTSGLTNRLFARVTLVDSDKVIEQRAVEIALRYDLWDENFSLASSVNEVVIDSRNLASLAEVEALLGALPLPALFDMGSLPDNRDLTLRVELLLNPIDREKMRMIRKWVAQNTAPTDGGDQGITGTNAVFNRIFEQYADSDLAAAWRATVSSAAFRVDALKHETN